MSPGETHRRSPWPGAALVVVLAALAWWWVGSERGSPGVPAPPGPGAQDASARLADADGPALPAGGAAHGAAVGDVLPLLDTRGEAPGEGAPTASSGTAYATGRLVVRLTWEEDGTPAAGVNVDLSSYDAHVPFQERPGGVTDDTGTWICDAAPSGATLVYHDRGGGARVMVAAGAETVLDVAIPPGIDLTGEVVAVADVPVTAAPVPDVLMAGTPVPDATVWLVVKNWLRFPAARTDAEGRFALRDVSRFVDVAATAPGHAPSMRVRLNQEDPTTPAWIDLPLGGPCGDLEVRVRGPEGGPVAGARVDLAVPTHRVRPLSSWREFERESRRAATDAAGRLVVRDLPEGTTTVTVDAEGFAEWMGSGAVEAGRAAVVDVELLPEAVVHGTVRDTSGRPVPEADVSARRAGLPFPLASATSGPDGRYALRGVPADATSLVATLGARDPVSTTTPLTVAPGDERAWDPVLDVGRRLDGRVVDVQGRPAGRHVLRFWVLAAGDPWDERIDTDAEGRFTLGACPPGPYMVEVFAWDRDESMPLAVVRDVQAAGGEIVVRLPPDTGPSAYIAARLVAADGTPTDGMRLAVSHAAQHPATARSQPWRHDEVSDRDLAGPLVPGDYRLTFVDTRGWGEPLGDLLVADLRAGETRDLGVLTPPARGRIVVRIERDARGAQDVRDTRGVKDPRGGAGATTVEPRLALVTAGEGGAGVHRNVTWDRDGDAWTAEVGAGAYRLHAFAPDVAPRGRDVTVEPGRVTEVIIVAGPIVRADIGFELPADGPDPPQLAASVRDARGETVWEGGTHETVPEWKAGKKPMASGIGIPSFPPDEDPAGRPRRRVLSWFFAPGTYTVSARFEGGPAVSRVFDVPDDPAATVRVDLSLR